MTCLGHISAKLVDLARICSDVTITGKDAAMDVKTEYTVVMVPGPNLLAVARHKECVHVAGRLCAKCYLLSKAAMIKRSDRARGYADSIVAATALLRGEPVPASIISRYIKSEKYVNEPDAGIALRLLKEKIKGRNERTLSPNFVLERALVLATIANFELVDAHCDSPGYKVDPKYRDFIKKFILQVEKNGFAGRHVGSFFWDFVNGTIDMKSAAVGVVVSAAQVVKKMRANATNMRGIKHTEGFMNLMANCKRWGARCVEGVSKHIIGYQVPPSTVNRALKKMLGTDKFIEVIHPSAEDLDELCALLHRGHGSEREIVAVAMDATKLAMRQQFCHRRNAILGGCVDQPGGGKLPVPADMTSEDFKLLLDQIVEADLMNVFGYSVARPGYGLVEVALDPHRSTRTTLSIAQKLLELNAFNSTSEFKRMNQILTALVKHASVVSVAADGGMEGKEILKSLHSTSGTKLDVVMSRELLPGYRGVLHRLGKDLVVCKTEKGVIVGLPDPDHGKKRMQEQMQAGLRALQLGPHHYAGASVMYAAGVKPGVIVKEDPMSDALTSHFFSEVTLRLVADYEGPLDFFGTAFVTFIVGEAYDAMQSDHLTNAERLVRIHFAQVCLAIAEKYVMDHPDLSRTNTFHVTPLQNFHRSANAVKALDILWLESYPGEPRCPSADGSARMERNFGNLRYKINSPGVLEMATRWLFRVTMSSLEAAGKVATVSHRKGYSASGPKTVHPSCNELVDKPTCIALMYEIDQVAVDFMWKRFGCPTNASAGPPGAPTDAGAHGAPVDSEGIPLVDDNAMEPDSLAYDPDSDAMHETISFNPAGPLMAQEMSETEMQVMNITIDEIEDVELDLSQLDAAEKTYLAAEEAEKENPAPAPAEAEGTVDPQTAALGRARGWLDGMRAAGECENEREAAKIFIELRKTADRAPPTTAAVLSAPAAARRKSVLFNVNGQPVDVASIVKERYAKTEAESKAQQNKARLDRWQKQSKVFANNKYISNIDTDVAPGHVFIVSHSADEVGLALITGVFQKYQGGFKPFASLPLREVHIVQLKMFAADSADVENQWTWTRVADGVRVYRCAQQLMARVGPLEDSFVFKPGGLASFEIGLLDLTDLQVYRGKAEAYWNAVVAPTQAGGAEDACLPAADAE